MAGSQQAIPQTDSQQSNGHAANDSQTASEFIDSQLQLEADAREALPFSFDRCTQPLGPLRQSVFSCLTCNPPPASPADPYTPAGVCYACSIACHGEHDLVELFNRRNFTCDCGTTRLPATSPCTLRIDPATGLKGLVHSQEASSGNTYNQNYRNRFCGCGEVYDPHQQKGTMYQCLGLNNESEGGCGEDWWHPECLLGLPRDWYQSRKKDKESKQNGVQPVDGSATEAHEPGENEEHPVPPGFPDEDQFETLICYKCTNSSPWIKQYAHADGFMYSSYDTSNKVDDREPQTEDQKPHIEDNTDKEAAEVEQSSVATSKKRKAEDDTTESGSSSPKKLKTTSEEEEQAPIKGCRKDHLLPAPSGSFSLFARDEDFRSLFCRCPDCYPRLSKFPQLMEGEEIYEPPMSEDGDNPEGGGSVGTGSLLDRGEAALSNIDRVRAIEGVMVYNHLKDKVKSFLQPFAESGKAVGAEDIKAYFEKLRGDAEAIRAAGGAAVASGDGTDGGGDNRKEESGY